MCFSEDCARECWEFSCSVTVLLREMICILDPSDGSTPALSQSHCRVLLCFVCCLYVQCPELVFRAFVCILVISLRFLLLSKFIDIKS